MIFKKYNMLYLMVKILWKSILKWLHNKFLKKCGFHMIRPSNPPKKTELFSACFYSKYNFLHSILYTFTVYLEIIFWVIEFKYIKCNILCLMVIYMTKFISDLQQVVVFSWYSGFLHQWNWPPRYNWNIVESGIKRHSPIMWTYTMSSLHSVICFFFLSRTNFKTC
jgi:hypothetical protein